MKQYSECPICKNTNFKEVFACEDYTVSHEKFTLNDCENCGFRFTNPVPEESKIGPYYESEEYISHSNTSKGIINSLYQAVRNITLKQKLRLVQSLSDGKQILDIGSGTGEFLNTCKEAGYKTFGIEPSEKAKSFAIKEYGLNIKSESELQSFQSNSFDVISMWHVLEHVYPLNNRIKEINRLLKKGGKAIIAVPNHDSYDAKKYKEYWAAYDVPRHLYHFKVNDIETLFSKYDFSLEKTLPMKFDSFYVSMLSEKYKNGGNLISAFFAGLLSNWRAKAGKSPGYSSQIYILRKN